MAFNLIGFYPSENTRWSICEITSSLLALTACTGVPLFWRLNDIAIGRIQVARHTEHLIRSQCAVHNEWTWSTRVSAPVRAMETGLVRRYIFLSAQLAHQAFTCQMVLGSSEVEARSRGALIVCLKGKCLPTMRAFSYSLHELNIRSLLLWHAFSCRPVILYPGYLSPVHSFFNL